MTEQPNTELLIIKTIQGLTTCINNELQKLYINKLSEVIYQKQAGAKARALESINSFEKNELYELQKAFE